MKKLILLFFVLIWYSGYTQPYLVITELVISPTDDDQIVNVKLTAVHDNELFYETEMYDIQNNIITLKICYFGNAATVVTYITTEREIQLPNIPDNYTLVAEVYFDVSTYPPPCDFLPEDMTDSASLSFSAPLVNDVVLNAPYFDQSENEVTIYSNPAVKEFFIESPYTGLQNIVLYDLQGKQVKTFEPQEVDTPRFDVSDLEAGVYFIAMKVEGRRVVKKLVVRK